MAIKQDNFLRAKRFNQEFNFDEVAKQVVPKTAAGSVVGDAIAAAIGDIPDATTTVTGLVNTGAQEFGGPKTFDTVVTVPTTVEASAAVAASAIDVQSASVFTKTITGATTFAFDNAPAAGKAVTFILVLTNAGTNVTWPAGTKWEGGTAPTLTASGVDVLGFLTIDNGTTWRGMVLSKDSK